MGTVFVLAFFGVFALAILQGLIRRKRNPYGEVDPATLPEELRGEIERVFPDFQPTRARVTRFGDQARVEGLLHGESVTIEGEFDGSGAMLEFELERHVSKRTRGVIEPSSLPESARREIERVLGEALPHFTPRRLRTGTLGGEEHFEMKGLAGEWKWEIAVNAAGRLLEVEKERRRNTP